jgi:hypothetical protein
VIFNVRIRQEVKGTTERVQWGGSPISHTDPVQSLRFTRLKRCWGLENTDGNAPQRHGVDQGRMQRGGTGNTLPQNSDQSEPHEIERQGWIIPLPIPFSDLIPTHLEYRRVPGVT